jgi:hypothetical protein
MNFYAKYAGLLLISILFLFFGVNVLISAYRLNDPFAFVMTFFASNFIILISASIAVGLSIRLWRHRFPKSRQCGLPDNESDKRPRNSG